ncbi:transglutaminase-like domain-containing protein [Sediminibacterium ginsengisoli]|nr:transglutaminase-like domain-containing protein [Sediminibacterium ginsengisoli]
MKLKITILFLLFHSLLGAQQIDTTRLNLAAFADSISGYATDDYEKARKILYWLSSRFEWTATDYQARTVNQVIARQGGNCAELAKVYMAMIKASDIRYRATAEINIHPYTERRQASAAALVKEKGNRYSVFGLQHNDHRWVEIYNKTLDRWEPADPSLGIIGLESWLNARMDFGERHTKDTAASNQMIVPFAVFIPAEDGSWLDRSDYYLLEQFDAYYKGRLSSLPQWTEWKAAVQALTQPSMAAFQNRENLHDHSAAISRVANAYAALKQAYSGRFKTLSEKN